MTIEEAAKATRRYSLAMTRNEWSGDVFWNVEGPDVSEQFNTRDEAQAACDRLNLRAVLRAIREPSEEMMKAAPRADLKTVYGQLYVWRAMIDALLEELAQP